ncbi:sigma-70 family RNA polymerase sigma factor [Halomonas sp. CSM-2]|nr:sigma-70 family RNA polymerase sigma factor [Halomonas sp. CSM-2]
MTTAMRSPDEHIAALRPKLVAFARLQLRDNTAAEDTVQDTLVTALEKHDTFAGRSAFETWVFGILKNKILERFRQQDRYVAWQNDDQSEDDALESLFQDNGRWRAANRPTPWGDPDQILENTAFWKVLDACLIALPENTARVFTMRELMELSTQEICQILDITETNCWVILHRARLKLRHCVEKGWLA